MLIIVLCVMLVFMFAVCTVLYLLLTETLDALRDAEREVSLTETLADIHHQQMTEAPEHVFWPRKLRMIRGGGE